MNDAKVDDLIIGTSLVMQELRNSVRRAATSKSPVLIQGPTGAGKELVALGLHSESGRRGQLIACNIAAISDSLFESEIMGHVRGAFTGAVRDHRGVLRRASHGTAFLDEIGDMPTSAQIKLLRVIDTAEVWPVGADVGEWCDFRLVTATNVDLAEAERHGRFRRDLLHRLRGITINVPALRDHPEDIAHLAAYFARVDTSEPAKPTVRVTPRAILRLEQHDWPGNVRELRQTIAFAALLSDGPAITEMHVERALAPAGGVLSDIPPAAYASHRRELLALLAKFAGDVNAVAAALGVTRSTAYRRMHRLGIEVQRRGPRLRLTADCGVRNSGVMANR
jgi:DNA-binding NtrC family response regulator